MKITLSDKEKRFLSESIFFIWVNFKEVCVKSGGSKSRDNSDIKNLEY